MTKRPLQVLKSKKNNKPIQLTNNNPEKEK